MSALTPTYFSNLVHARALIAAWWHDYKQARPHSSLERIPPAQFAARYRSAVVDHANQEIV